MQEETPSFKREFKKKKKKSGADVLLLIAVERPAGSEKGAREGPHWTLCSPWALSLGLPPSGGCSKTHVTLTFVCNTGLRRLLVDTELLLRSNLPNPERFSGLASLHSAFL